MLTFCHEKMQFILGINFKLIDPEQPEKDNPELLNQETDYKY